MSEQENYSDQAFEEGLLGREVGSKTDDWVDKGSAMSLRATANLNTFKDLFWYKIFFENAKTFKRIFYLIVVGTALYMTYVGIQTGSADKVLDVLVTVLTFMFNLIFGIFRLFFWIFFSNVYTAFPFWVFAITRTLIIFLMTQQHDVFLIMWFEPPKTLKQVIFHKYLDDGGKPYIGIRTSFWRRLIYGIERYPLHEDLYANFTNQLNVVIDEVSPGSDVVSAYHGTGIILIDPDLEDGEPIDVHSIFRIIERPSDEPGMVYRAAYANLDQAAPVAFIQSVFYGHAIEYWKRFADEREKRMEMEVELQYQKYGGHLNKLKEFYPRSEGLAAEYSDDEWIESDDFRFFDDVKARQKERKQLKG